jgi:DNA-binding FadR family transcriptional regulator
MEEMVPLDMAFHLVIGEASHNSLFLAIMEAINACFLEGVFSWIPQGKQEEDYADLLRLLQAIKAGEARVARKVVREHIARFNRLIIRSFREKHPEDESFLEVPA